MEDSGCSAVESQKTAESVLEEVGTNPKTSSRWAWEVRFWSQKCWKVRVYSRVDWDYFSLELSTKIMYICGKCNFTICIGVIFTISMQKTVRPQIRPGKKKNSQLKVKKNEFFKVFNSQNILTKMYESAFLQLKTLIKVTPEKVSGVV